MIRIEIEREDDGRWIAEVMDLPGVLTYGQTREEAIERDPGNERGLLNRPMSK
jgi:hypothetical protein